MELYEIINLKFNLQNNIYISNNKRRINYRTVRKAIIYSIFDITPLFWRGVRGKVKNEKAGKF